jgi:hypothetical protein
MGVGVVLLLFTLDVVTGSVLAVLWPALLIVVGAAILLRLGGGPRPAEGARIDAIALFGGVEILVPRGWRVETNGK